MSAIQSLMASYANPLRVVDGADFDGTNDYMTRGAGLTGAADSKSGIFSAWVRIDGGDGTARRIFSSATVLGSGDFANLSFYARVLGTNKLELSARNAAGTPILRISDGTARSAGATWLHILASWDLAVAGARHLYVSDVSNIIEHTFTDDTIAYTVADWITGANGDGTFQFNGCIAELYFAPGQYLDFSLIANRRKFISASGKPVHLGATGSLPTGTAPLVYQHLDDAEAVANFATNRGTGGNFTITGTLDTASTSPSD